MASVKCQIRARRECTKCHGGGWVDHPLWLEFFSLPRGEAGDATAWFAERGFGLGQVPPEEIECDECDGSGHIEFWMDVAGG